MAANNADTDKEARMQKIFYLIALCLGSLTFLFVANAGVISKDYILFNTLQFQIIFVIGVNWVGAFAGGVIGFSGD